MHSVVDDIEGYGDSVEHNADSIRLEINAFNDIKEDLDELKEKLSSYVEDALGELDNGCTCVANNCAEWSETIWDEFEESVNEILEKVKADLIEEHAAFADLCTSGYKAPDFQELVERIFEHDYAKEYRG